MMCVYIAVIYGILYILFTTFTFVYEGTYGFTARSAGLTFIASGVGMLLGLAFVGTYSDMKIRKVMASEKEVQPEDRLPTLVVLPASLLIPAGLILYGWSAEKAAFWIVPMIGTSLIGFGMICLMMSIQTYLIDAFTIHAASVTAANAVLRSILGALLPLCGLQVYDRLGLGWGNTMMGLIVLALAPVPLVFRVYGQRIRENPRWQVSF